MSPESYIGSIGYFAGTYDPIGWIACEGQTLEILEYGNLYNIIRDSWGATVGTFNLPDFRPTDADGNRIDWNQPGMIRTCICYQGLYPQSDIRPEKYSPPPVPEEPSV